MENSIKLIAIKLLAWEEKKKKLCKYFAKTTNKDVSINL